MKPIGVLVVTALLQTLQLKANIARESCYTDAEFFKIASDFKMSDPETKTLQVSSLGECLDICISNSTCRALNIKRTGGKVDCEHLTRDRNSHPHDIVAAAGWNYYDTGLYKPQVIDNAFLEESK